MFYSGRTLVKHILGCTALALMVALVVGCESPVDPVAPLTESASGSDDLILTRSNVGNDGPMQCQTVSGSLDQTAIPGNPLSGTISGDVEGTVVTAVTGLPEAHGSVLFLPGAQTWKVTGGIIESLFGQTLHFEVDVVGAQAPLIRINTRARVVEGAQKGNLTYHGITDVSDPALTTSHLEYHGVICP